MALPVAKFRPPSGSRRPSCAPRCARCATRIDEYKRYSDAGLIPVDLGTDGYPEELEVLVEGVDLVGQIDSKVKFLRRIPSTR